MSANFTYKNLNDVPDAAAKLGAGEFQRSHFAAPDFGSPETGFTYHQILPGKRQGFAHRHKQAEEFYVVIGGSGRVKLDDDVVELKRLDAFRVAPQVLRAWEAGPDGLEVLAFGPRVAGDKDAIPSDGEVVADWWKD